MGNLNNPEKSEPKKRKFDFEFNPRKKRAISQKNKNLNESLSFNKFFLSTFDIKKQEKNEFLNLNEEMEFSKDVLLAYYKVNLNQKLTNPSNFYFNEKKKENEEKIYESDRIKLLRRKLFSKKNNINDKKSLINEKLLKNDFVYNLEKLKNGKKKKKKSEFTFRSLKKISIISGGSNYKKIKRKKSVKKNNDFFFYKKKKINPKKKEKLKSPYKIKESENLEDTLIRASLENKKKRENFFKKNSQKQSPKRS